MKARVYRAVGSAYIIGRVCRRMRKGRLSSLFQVRWLDTQLQHAVEHVSVGLIQEGIKDYCSLGHLKSPDWKVLTQPDNDDDIEIDDEADLEVGEVFE